MDKIKLDIKTLILIITTTCVMAGFYYTAEARLTSLETEISFLNGQIRSLKNQDKHLNRLIRKIKDKKDKTK